MNPMKVYGKALVRSDIAGIEIVQKINDVKVVNTYAQ